MNPIRSMLLAGSQNAWLSQQATRRRFVRRAVSRFMPGESTEDALAAARSLAGDGFGTILTQLGENISQESEADSVVQHYLELLELLQAAGLDAEVSVKLTQLGLDLGTDMALRNTCRLAVRAVDMKSRLWIDMEATPCTDQTLEVFRGVREQHANVGLCLQTYLRRTREDLETLLPLGPAIRLVKGAYREPANLAFPSIRDVDENFFWLSQRLLSDEARSHGAFLTVGTHDPMLIERIETHIRTAGVPSDTYEFALLYGIQRAQQLRLVHAGHPTRVLISYGAHWFPWYMRRLAERPANLWFVARNMFSD